MRPWCISTACTPNKTPKYDQDRLVDAGKHEEAAPAEDALMEEPAAGGAAGKQRKRKRN